MDSIDRAIETLNDSTDVASSVTLRVDGRCQLVTTLAYLCLMLSVPLTNLEALAWFAIYQILWSTLTGVGYSVIFRRSLIVLPFVALIGIFNPILDHRVAFTVGNVAVTEGWITFTSIIVRGLLSVQAVVLLVATIGFVPMCRAMRALRVPNFLVTQLMLLYRYMIVLLQEVQTMHRARDARGFGRKLPLKMWGVLIGQLFVRTVNRAERIHKAMTARLFSGELHFAGVNTITLSDLAISAAWIAAFVALRFVNIPQLLHFQ